MSEGGPTASLLNPIIPTPPLASRSVNIPSPRSPQSDHLKSPGPAFSSLLSSGCTNAKMSSSRMFPSHAYPNPAAEFPFNYHQSTQQQHSDPATSHSQIDKLSNTRNPPNTQARPARESRRPPGRIWPSHNPLVRHAKSTPEARQTQRQRTYLNGVRGKREDKVWSVREDQIQYSDFMAQQRAWEERQEREAPPLILDEEEDDELVERWWGQDTRTLNNGRIGESFGGMSMAESTASFGAGDGSSELRWSQVLNSQPPLYPRPSFSPSIPRALTPDAEECEADAVLLAEALELEATLENNKICEARHEDREEDPLPPPIPDIDGDHQNSPGEPISEMEFLDSEFEAEMGQLVESMQSQGIHRGDGGEVDMGG